VRGGILFDMKRYTEAIEAFGNVPQKNHFAFVQLAAAHAYLGNSAAAGEALARARELRPNISLSEIVTFLPHGHLEAVEHLLDGMKKAGLAT
jgi:hypothetical protein